jgi:hypothetical protein
VRIGTMKVATRGACPFHLRTDFRAPQLVPRRHRNIVAARAAVGDWPTQYKVMPVSSADRNGPGVRFDRRTEGATPASHVNSETLRPTQTAGSLRGFITAVQPAVAIANTYAGTLMTLLVGPTGR